MAFCFCGTKGLTTNLNSIESIQTDLETEWKTLPVNVTIAKTCQLSGVSYLGSIIVFGASFITARAMYEFYQLMD